MLVRSVRLLALLGGVSLAFTGECQPLFLGVFFSFFLIGLKIEDFPALSRFFSAAQPYLAVFIFAVALIDFFYLSNSFLLTVAHFLLSVQGVRLLALRTNRECFGSVLLSSLMMLSSSTLSVDWTFFLMLFVFLLAVIWTLMLLTLLEENKEASVPGSLIEGSLLWRALVPVLRWSTAVAFLIAFACCAAVFIFFPRFNFQGFRGQFLQPVHKSGFTSQVDLDGSGRIFEDNSVVMRIEVDEADKSLWTGYLRGRALEVFNGRVWDRFSASGEQIFQQRRGKYWFPGAASASKRLLRQRIYLESMDSPLLFAQASPVSIEIDRPFLELGREGSINRRNGDVWRIHYDVESAPSVLDPAVISAKTGLPVVKPFPKKAQRDVFQRKRLEAELLFVPDALLGTVKRLSDAQLGRAPDALAKARALEKYFRANFTYSLDSGAAADPKRNPIETFLTSTKKGHCEYFAAAMCLMLRAQKIPARLATGFLSHEWNSQGHYFIVRMKHAHAWVEADIEPYGWIGFDPSPRDTGVGPAADLLSRWSETMDYLNLRWNRYILSYDFERQVEIVKSVTQQSSAISSRLGGWGNLSKKITLWLGSWRMPSSRTSVERQTHLEMRGSLLALVGLSFVAMIVMLVLRRWRRRHDRVWFYRPLVRRLEKRLGKKPASQTLREFLTDDAKLGSGAAAARFLRDAYYHLRFDPTARLSPAENAQILEKIKQL